MKFWDASAIVPLLVREVPSDALFTMLEYDSSMLVWWGTVVECASAIARRQRDGSLGMDESGVALGRLKALSSAWDEVLPSNLVREQAQRVLRLHPLRAADALQLAAALVASEHQPATLAFVCLDGRLNDAAGREGFEVVSAP